MLPKPYYENELGRLYHADCLEILPHLEPVDLVLTDPPYGIGFKYESHDDTPEKYGEFIIQIDIPDNSPLLKNMLEENDNCGDTCRVWEGEGVLIPSDYLSCKEIDHIDGSCDDDCEYCKTDGF